MKKKTIEKILRGQFANFCKSIQDEKVQRLVIMNSIITGGSITSLLLDEKINDFDIYFTNTETALAVCNYYSQFVKDPVKISVITDERDSLANGVRITAKNYPVPRIDKKKQKGKFYPEIITENAISLSNNIQLITRFVGDPEEIHRNFDFVHVKNYWTSLDGNLHLNAESLESILTKELKYIGSLYPVASLFRLRKFLSRGWRISAGEILKIAFQVSELDLKDPITLRNQLIGVDILYFVDLIKTITKDLEIGMIDEIDSLYLSRIIDEVFNENDDYNIEDFINKNRYAKKEEHE